MASEKIDALELDIEAKLNAENLDKLIDRLALLGKVLDNLKGKSVSVNIKETGNASEKASSQVDKLTTSFLNQAVRITALIAVYRKLSSVISDGIVSSMEYTENLNLFTVSLGEYAENANKYANTVRDALGIDPSGWIRTQGVFNTLIEGFGVGAEQAAYMSQNLTQLTYDIASFYNLSISDAEKKIQSAVAGELEPVRRLGYDLSQNALTAIAQNPEYYGKTTYYINEETGALEANTEALEDNTARVVANFNDLTQGEKVQLRYIALMTQVTEAQGDMARTLNDPANQMRIFKEQTEMTSRALGNAFIPMLNKAMPYVIAFARVLEETFQKIAAYLGYELPDMSDRINVDDAVGGYEDVEDALEGGAKAAKKIRDYTIGIDELNVLRPDDNTGRGSGSDNQYALGSIYETPGYDFLGTAIENSINNAKSQIEAFAGYLSEHPLKVTGTVLWEGAGTIGEGFIEWLLGKTPEELAQDASDLGISVKTAFINAFFSKGAERKVNFYGILGETFWRTFMGITPEELAQIAEEKGITVGEAMLDYLGNMFGDNIFTEGSKSFVEQLIFGGNSADELGRRAAEAGNEVGEQFLFEFGKAALKIINSNPALKWLYEVETGRSAEKDLENLTRRSTGGTGIAHSGGGGSGRTRNRAYSKTDADKNLTGYDWGTAKNAKSHGSELAKSFADGIKSGIGDIESATQDAYNSALDGVNNKGMGASDFLRVSLEEINGYVNGVRSGYSKGYAAGKELFSSSYTGVTDDGNGSTKYYNAASDNVLNYINGILGGASKAKNAGDTLYDNAYTGVSHGGKAATEFADTAAAMSRSYSDSLLYKMNEALTSGDTLYKNAYKGVSNDGKAGNNFSTLADDMAKLFANSLGSTTAKQGAYSAGEAIANEGSWGAVSLTDDYEYAGSMSGSGFVKGMLEWIDEAESAGKTVGDSVLSSLKLALDERSPSHEAEKIGKFFSQGYAVGILEDMDKATSAVETMAKASIRAANTDFISDVSVSIPKSNAGYGIGMNNESAMASLASNIYQAVVSGMATYGNGNGGDTIITIDGREIFRVVQSEARKNGATISNGAFSR